MLFLLGKLLQIHHPANHQTKFLNCTLKHNTLEKILTVETSEYKPFNSTKLDNIVQLVFCSSVCLLLILLSIRQLLTSIFLSRLQHFVGQPSMILAWSWTFVSFLLLQLLELLELLLILSVAISWKKTICIRELVLE